MHRNYIEVVGLIGAGKSTRCTGYKKAQEGQRPNVAVEEEESSLVADTVYPVLEDVYSGESGAEPRKEYLVEAVFAILRLAHLRAILGLNGVTLAEYVDELLAIFRVGEYTKDGNELEDLRKKLKEETKGEKYSPKVFQVLERGSLDVLCFILERIACYSDEEFYKCGDMMHLFIQVYTELVTLLFPWTHYVGLPKDEDDFEDLIPARANYSIIMVPVSVRESAKRIRQRSRAIEIDQHGEVKSRVMLSNMGLANVYGKLFENLKDMGPVEFEKMAEEVDTQDNFNKTLNVELGLRVAPVGSGFEIIKLHKALPKLWKIFEGYWTRYYSRYGLRACFRK